MSGGPPFSRETGSTFKETCRAERTSDEVAFLERSLNLTPGCRILDVPCGNGRLALPLAERGYRVTGVDITKALVQEALSTSREANLNLELRRVGHERPALDGDIRCGILLLGKFRLL